MHMVFSGYWAKPVVPNCSHFAMLFLLMFLEIILRVVTCTTLPTHIQVPRVELHVPRKAVGPIHTIPTQMTTERLL
jgi:hypothetical protein